ncbi:Universal stress protein family protein [Rhodococcus koreensis]|jgi:hypothetical protein|uniref:Universal stress protein family protein n=1 Tax=Rhodococcus koreensis TaxID=99653 RepID=A0A1H5EUR3_9NOCA|nr:Universal stress protein family protein [Rhodococcus koreensis]
MTDHRPIVVGVDGSQSSLQAVVCAAEEAALRRTPLTLATTVFVPGARGVPSAGLKPSSPSSGSLLPSEWPFDRNAQPARVLKTS